MVNAILLALALVIESDGTEYFNYNISIAASGEEILVHTLGFTFVYLAIELETER